MSLRSFLCSAALSIVLTILVSEVHADEKKAWKPTFAFAVAVAYPVQVVTPPALEGKPIPTPAILQSFIVSLPVSERWSLSAKLGGITPFSAMQLAPQLQLGAAVRVHGPLSLAGSLLYRYVPHWASLPSDAHIVGGTFGPLFKLKNVRLLTPMAALYNTTTKTVVVTPAVEVLIPFD